MRLRSIPIACAVALLALAQAPLAVQAQAATRAVLAQENPASTPAEPQRHVGAAVEDFARKDYQAAATEARAIGRRLASGGAWARAEVARGFDSLGDSLIGSLSRLERSFGSKSRASPLDVGA